VQLFSILLRSRYLRRRLEAHQLHRSLGLGFFHEAVPDKLTATIFRHQHGDAWSMPITSTSVQPVRG